MDAGLPTAPRRSASAILHAMLHRFTIDPARRRATAFLQGVATVANIRALQDAARADPAFDPAFDVLVDCDGITAFEGSLTHLIGLAETDPFRHPARCAYFVRRNGMYGVLRMWETANRDLARREVRVFRTREEAEAWLDRRPGPADAPVV
jgi:hypothetical protein